LRERAALGAAKLRIAVMDVPPLPIEPPPCPYRFPDARSGQGPHGVVCLGGDFSPGTLLEAYRRGLFPWPASPDTVPWCSPDPRAVYLLNQEDHLSRSLRRRVRAGDFLVTIDRAFDDVVRGCSKRDQGTWILPSYVHGFRELHALGWCHSVEVWDRADGALVGGIYGIAIGGVFAGESMFHTRTDASKIAFFALMKLLRRAGFRLVDVQVESEHLMSLGCVTIPRERFLGELASCAHARIPFPREVPADLFADA
jgi:leucyl/phenylalanyl-tRNA--protein transferase